MRTTEDYLAELVSGCPLCGTTEEQESRRDSRVRDLQRRVTRLQQRLEELEQSPQLVMRWRAHLGQMCGICQVVMTGMSAATDAAELCVRLRRQIADFDEEVSHLQQAA